jgi:acetyl-CoA C-acetyltransferase
MTSKHSVLIAEPVRTAIGTFGGTLKDIPAVELGATAIRAALQRSGLRSALLSWETPCKPVTR